MTRALADLVLSDEPALAEIGVMTASSSRGVMLDNVNEEEFWLRLEYRVSAELAGMDDDRLRFLWCDGFRPEEYRPNGDPPSIQGRAWIGNPMDQWTFTLLLPEPVGDVPSIDWQNLLPAADVTGWLAPDPSSKYLELQPGVATPDTSAQMRTVWIFHGEGAPFSAGVFRSEQDGLRWAKKWGVSGILTEYPVGDGCYDIAVRDGHFRPSKPHHGTSDHVAKVLAGLDPARAYRPRRERLNAQGAVRRVRRLRESPGETIGISPCPNSPTQSAIQNDPQRRVSVPGVGAGCRCGTQWFAHDPAAASRVAGSLSRPRQSPEPRVADRRAGSGRAVR